MIKNSEIQFCNIDKKIGKIESTVLKLVGEQEKTENIWFEFNLRFLPSDDVIAAALCTLCGQEYEKVYIDLIISKKIYENLNRFVNGGLEVREISNEERQNNQKDIFLLNFSGGYDSLAALCLMPKNTKLVSVDWGGNFQRETNFFKIFEPLTVRTNVRQLRYTDAHWTFMGIGSILFSEYVENTYNVFGTILEAYTYNFRYKYERTFADVPPFNSIGLKEASFVLGLTEIGTALVVTHFMPEYVQESLTSLSGEKTEKRYRKELITKIVCEKFDRKITFEDSQPPEKQIKFGNNLAVDFLCLYFIKNKGVEEANKMVTDIPEDIVEKVNGMHMTFYERFNTAFIYRVPDKYRKKYMSKITAAEILPYDEVDWKEYNEIKNILARYHVNIVDDK